MVTRQQIKVTDTCDFIGQPQIGNKMKTCTNTKTIQLNSFGNLNRACKHTEGKF